MDLRLAIGLIGSALLVSGVITTKLGCKNLLFATGNASMFLYALLGWLTGGPVFFLILQVFIALSTVCMLLRIPDKYDTPVLAVGGLALIAWALSMFQGYSTVLFVAGLVVLGMGFALNAGTQRREAALFAGSAIIAVFSLLAHDWIFVGLNALFALFSLMNIARMRMTKR